VVNPFKAVPREDYNALAVCFLLLIGKLEDAELETKMVRAEVVREVKNAENLTHLCARAVQSTDILEQTLIERQIGVERDPSLVLVVGSAPEQKQRRGFIPLSKRRRDAAKRSDLESSQRSMMRKVTATLPPLPLTKEDREAMREVIQELMKETA
jgi:hypothetical protein